MNISAGGPISDFNERAIIYTMLDNGITIVAAAGNTKINLDKNCNYFPACYDERIHVIGTSNRYYSNYGKIVDVYLNGTEQTAYGITLSGTSQAAAIYTGKLIKKMYKEQE